MPTISRRSFLAGLALTALAGMVGAGCAARPAAATEARSSRPRQTAPDVTPDEVAAMAAGGGSFALEMLRALREDGESLFFSPYSIAQAMLMVYAGARGATATQMADALRLSLPPERVHPAANALGIALATREKIEGAFELVVANDVWAQQGYPVRPEYLDTLAEHYGAGVQLADFAQSPEAARQAINGRVSDQTGGRIVDLMPQGSIDTMTRLVLTNAITFLGKWQQPFEAGETSEQPFHAPSGQVLVPTMRQEAEHRYAADGALQAVELAYRGGASMLAILPSGDLSALEDTLDDARLRAIDAALTPTRIDLRMPKLELRSPTFSIKEALQGLGMTDAFTAGAADLSGIDGTRDLFVSDGFHQAVVRVDEEGTEAAAATGASISLTSAPVDPPTLVAFDRPYLFLIRDARTGAVLFVGRVTDPVG